MRCNGACAHVSMEVDEAGGYPAISAAPLGKTVPEYYESLFSILGNSDNGLEINHQH